MVVGGGGGWWLVVGGGGRGERWWRCWDVVNEVLVVMNVVLVMV